MADPRLAEINTPLCSEACRACLQAHPDLSFTQYILRGITQGFRVGFDRGCELKAVKKNMHSATQHPEIIDQYIQKECKAGTLVGPFQPQDISPPVHISQFGVIPKGHQGNAWRLIVDLSAPDAKSVNDGIKPESCSLEYTKIGDAVKTLNRMGSGTLIAKVDIKSAYRIIPVHPADRHLLGMEWNGATYIDATLPFGLRSVPKIFNAVADALHWILLQHGVSQLWHYLDDYLTAGRADSEECQRNCSIIHSICELLGVPLATEKCTGPQTCLEYLGFELDTQQGEIRLPREKLQRIEALLQGWGTKRSCTKHELDSLIGLLQHASTVVKPGRSFLRRMIVLAKAASKPWHHIRINASFRADLAWWIPFLRAWNGISMMSMLDDQVPGGTVTSDASGSWGCGAFSERKWFQLEWEANLLPKSIAVKEMIPIIIASAIWGKSWKGKLIRYLCDNQAVVAVIKARYSRDDELMHLLRTLFFFEALFGYQIEAQHLPGKHNELADNLSRNKLSSFLSNVHPVEQSPTPIPPELLRLLQDTQTNWTSATWTDMFN